MKSKLLFLLCAFLFIPMTLEARTWHVKQNGTGDCTTIQACVDAAGSGDTVLVGPGKYVETIWTTDKDDFVIMSESGPSYTTVENQWGWSGFMFERVGGQSAISGFTIAHTWSNRRPGGAISCFSSNLLIQNNVIFDCGATSMEGGPAEGGAIGMAGASGVIRGNTIYSCWTGPPGQPGWGGGIILYVSPNVSIESNIIAGCLGAGIYGWDCVPQMSCNNVWGNSPSNYGGIIADQTGLNGNISTDPLFCNTASWNLSLFCNSPCLNPPGCGRMGALPVGCGSTSVEEVTWGRIKALFK